MAESIFVQSGKLRHVLMFQVKDDTTDSEGALTGDYSDLQRRYGSIQPTGGVEVVDGDKVIGVADVLITVRQGQFATPKMRITHNSEVYQILSVSDVDMINRRTLIRAKRIDA